MKSLTLFITLCAISLNVFAFSQFDSPNYNPAQGTFSVTVKNAPKNDVTIRAVVDKKFKPAIHITRTLNDLLIQVKDRSLINGESIDLEVLQHGRIVRRMNYSLVRTNGTQSNNELADIPTAPGIVSKEDTNHANSDHRNVDVLFYLPNKTDYVSLPETWAVKAVDIENSTLVQGRFYVDNDGRSYAVKTDSRFNGQANFYIDTGREYFVFFMRDKDGYVTHNDILLFADQYQVRGVSEDQIIAGFYAFHKRDFDRNALKLNSLIRVPSSEVLSFYSRKEAKQIGTNVRKWQSSSLPRLIPLNSQEIGMSLQCRDFRIEVGFLKSSIEKALAKCGYKIGNWRFGDVDSEYDYSIEHAYVIQEVGLLPFLSSIESTYLLKGFPNRLDSTVDFEPARGQVSPSLNLQ